MTIYVIREMLMWCLLFNYGLLIVWFLFFSMAHEWLYRLHGRWFPIPVDKFNAIHYGAMAIYKILIFVFNLTPFVALYIIG